MGGKLRREQEQAWLLFTVLSLPSSHKDVFDRHVQWSRRIGNAIGYFRLSPKHDSLAFLINPPLLSENYLSSALIWFREIEPQSPDLQSKHVT